MGRTYVTKAGDTLAGIATIYYGNPGQSGLISAANPKITNPSILPIGIVVTIPDIPGVTDIATPPSAPLVGGDKDEISITIEGTQFSFWDNVSINRSMDKIGDTFNFSAPFDSSNKDMVEAFKPFGYKKVAVNVGGEKIITGIAMKQDPESSPNARTIAISGYSLPGVLSDCNYKGALEFKNTDLEQITNTLIQPYSLSASFLA
jgi:phage tail protein X